MTTQPGKQTILLQILPSISRTKDNQTIKYGQLTWEKFFLKNHTKYGRETIPRPFSKK